MPKRADSESSSDDTGADYAMQQKSLEHFAFGASGEASFYCHVPCPEDVYWFQYRFSPIVREVRVASNTDRDSDDCPLLIRADIHKYLKAHIAELQHSIFIANYLA
uniref:SAWADEE domain-containing protein n=1 Tax=Steinernema glaseri TaxID=37863 RepID=A0A1I7YFU0_9BILA